MGSNDRAGRSYHSQTSVQSIIGVMACSCPRACVRCCSAPKTTKEANRMLAWAVFGFFLGLALIIVASIVPGIVINVVDDGLAESLIIDDEQSSGHEGFTTNRKAPTMMEIVVLDIMNPLEILEGAKPVLIERGPYVYRVMKERYNLTWSQDGEILSWREHEYMIFDEDASAESDTDRLITSLYMPFVALRANLAGSTATAGTRSLLTILANQLLPTERARYFTTKTARELLFGYPDTVMATAHFWDKTIDPSFTGLIFNGTSREATENRKDTSNWYSMWTGKNHANRIRQFITWRNMTHIMACSHSPCPPNPTIDGWATHDAGLIKGCDGSAFEKDVTEYRKLDVWFGSFFRSVSLEYKDKVEFRGVDLLRFGLPSDITNNASLTPNNALYYQDGTSGFFNITSLSSNVPVYISNAQFRGVPSSMADRVEVVWQQRDAAFYETSFDVEPISGAGFHVSSSTQVNVEVGPLTGMSVQDENGTSIPVTWFESMPYVYMPIFYARQEASIPQDDADEFTTKVYGALLAADVALYLGAIGGTILIIMAVVFMGMSLRVKRALRGQLGLGENSLIKSEEKSRHNNGGNSSGNGSDHRHDHDDGNASDSGIEDGMKYSDAHDDTTPITRPASESVDISYQHNNK